MKKTIDKTKWLDYTIPSTGEEIGWMAFVAYRDKKDNHKHLIVPWKREYSITHKDSAFLKRLGKKIVKAIRECHREEKMRRNRKSASDAKGKRGKP